MKGLSRLALEGIISAIPAGVVVIEKDNGRVTYVNDRAIQLYGVNPKGLEMPNHSTKLMKILTLDGQIYPPERLPASIALLTGKEAKDDLIIERPNGSRITVTVSAMPIRNEQGEVTSAVGIFTDITKRKKAEESALFQSQLLNLVGESVIVTNGEGTVIYWNQTAEEMYGWKRSEALGHNVVDLTVPKMAQKDANEIIHRLAKGERWTGGYQVNRKDGTEFPIYATDTPMLDENGKLLAIIGVSTDITERKKAEEALRQSEERFKLVAEAAKVFVYEVDLEKNNMTVFRGEEVLGYKPGEIPPEIGWWYSQIHPDDRAEAQQKARKAIEKGKDGLIGYRIRRKQGDYISVHDTAKMVKDNHGKAIRIIGGLRDVTERKRAEEALNRLNAELEQQVEERTEQVTTERERFFNMLENMPVMVCLITADYKIPYANRMFRERFGEAKGRYCYDYVGCVNAPCKQCQSLIPLQTGKPHHWIANFPDGSVIDARDFPFTDVDGTKMILEADIDITERMNLQKQLQEKERLATIGQTAGMVGHDIRNPLQAMMSDVYLLKEELSTMPQCKTKAGVVESLDSLEHNIGYVNKIVSDLQDYTRVLKPNITTVNLADTIRSILTTVPESIETQVLVKPTIVVNTDDTYLRRILTNLVVNAVQAMPNGGKLTIQANKEQGQLIISVQDTGMGIPEDVRPNLFKPLYTTKSKGQGLGLAVVQRLVVEGLKGKVHFETTIGKGTQFIVELPASSCYSNR